MDWREDNLKEKNKSWSCGVILTSLTCSLGLSREQDSCTNKTVARTCGISRNKIEQYWYRDNNVDDAIFLLPTQVLGLGAGWIWLPWITSHILDLHGTH